MILGAGQAAERHYLAALLIHGQYVVRCAPFGDGLTTRCQCVGHIMVYADHHCTRQRVL